MKKYLFIIILFSITIILFWKALSFEKQRNYELMQENKRLGYYISKDTVDFNHAVLFFKNFGIQKVIIYTTLDGINYISDTVYYKFNGVEYKEIKK